MNFTFLIVIKSHFKIIHFTGLQFTLVILDREWQELAELLVEVDLQIEELNGWATRPEDVAELDELEELICVSRLPSITSRAASARAFGDVNVNKASPRTGQRASHATRSTRGPSRSVFRRG